MAPPGEWLIEVAPAAVRARLHDTFGADAGERRLARSRALFTAREEPGPSPWYDAHRIEAVLTVRPRHVRDWLRGHHHDDVPIEILIHGVDTDVDRFWRAIGSPPRGPQGRRIHLVRLDDGAATIITAPPKV